MADRQILDRVGVADRGRHAAGEVGLFERVRSWNAMDLVLDDGDPLQEQKPVRHVDAAAAPIARGEHEGWESGRGLDEIPRDRRISELERLAVADPAAIRIDAPSVGEESADSISGDR
jgi:hypothetical protein